MTNPIPSWLQTPDQIKAGMMKVDLSYLEEPTANHPPPTPYAFKDDSIEVQIKRHQDTASRLTELAAWNMKQVEELNKCK